MRNRVVFSFASMAVGAMVMAVLWSDASGAEQTRIELSPLVGKMLDDATLSDAQRRDLLLFHGQWGALESPTTGEHAAIALYRYDLDAQALSDAAAPPLLRARAALIRGDAKQAVELLAGDDSPQAAVLRGQAMWQQGDLPSAVAQLEPWRDKLSAQSIDSAGQLVAATKALVMLAQLEGRPGDDYELAMRLYGKANQQLDRLYWPAKLAEAELLFDKDNSREAFAALMETLSLNPRCGRAWFLMGRIGLNGFNFDVAGKAIERLRQINGEHLLADLLETHMYVQQRDGDGARRVVQSALGRYPRQRELLALAAAAEAIAFDQQGLTEALAAFDRVWPAGPLAHYMVGRYLSSARQYQAAQQHLRTAVERLPNWSAPRLELGLLLMQSGDEDQALQELRYAVRLDPFQRRVQNQLKLAQELAGYQQIRTEHFIIKYSDGVDRVLARLMPQALERIYDDVTTVFAHQPARPTLIEIMPDKERFAVRITGMPEIWTIAATTGNVIAITPPREGAGQRGMFDWENVIRHEFVHTVTLDQTRYRVPHWFTEACAVAMERQPQNYIACQLLAHAVHDDKLFDLDQINWAFVRPKTPADRPLAYAQAHWMVQYITETYGHDAIIAMLSLFRDGTTNHDAIARVTGGAADQFMSEFQSWARGQVDNWGLTRQPSDPRLDVLASASDEDLGLLLAELIELFPRRPELLLRAAQLALASGDYDQARAAVLRYAAVKPVDPWSSRQLAKLALAHGQTDHAIGPLEQLDRVETVSGKWARQLSKVYYAAGQSDLAAEALTRALYREPYNAEYHEAAAAMALKRSHDTQALQHIEALTVLEPDQSRQWLRLAAMHHKLGQTDPARRAAEKAKQLDPNAPVQKFLK